MIKTKGRGRKMNFQISENQETKKTFYFIDGGRVKADCFTQIVEACKSHNMKISRQNLTVVNSIARYKFTYQYLQLLFCTYKE